MAEKEDTKALTSKMAEMEKEISMLHDVLTEKGINSRGTTDIFGRKFAQPVDAEHKAVAISLLSFANPHMRAFHTSWFGFFSAFFSMFAAAPLITKIRKPTSLNLTKAQIGEANISAVSTNIVMRAITGWLCDMFGARRSLSILLLVTTPAILSMNFVNNADGFIACRALIGISLATFVTCQVWCSQMFNKKVVGLANATAAGWGNLGGGVTNLLMPQIFQVIYDNLSGDPLDREDRAWRLCYLVPLGMHIIGGLMVLTGRDLPDGNIKELESSGAKQKSKGSIVLKTGLSNVNAWILTVTYGMCFGIELTMNSIASVYFQDYHGMNPRMAGMMASLYGMMNLFARSAGGLISDWANKRFGMRGRIWAMWIVQTIEGVFCLLLGTLTLDKDSLFGRPNIQAWTKMDRIDPVLYPEARDGWVPVTNVTIPECGSDEAAPPEWFQIKYDVSDKPIMFLEPPFSRNYAAEDCISNSNLAGQAVFLMILFSLCVQAAEGLHYGVVPYVSRPALGIVSGMVGAGGNLGAVISLWSFFRGGDIRTDEGLKRLGFMVIGLTATMFFIYFPDMGGMLVPAGGLGSYDPQLIKPPEDYRGADSMDFTNVKPDDKKSSTTDGAA